MSRPPAVIAAADKVRIVLSILAGEMTCAEARVETRSRRRRSGTGSGLSWTPARLVRRPAGVRGRTRLSGALAAEVEELKAALGEAHVELRVWKKSAEYRLGPSRTSK
jgi:transposase